MEQPNEAELPDLPEWERRATAGLPGGPRPVIRASWARSAAHGLSPERPPPVRSVAPADLARRLGAHEALVAIAAHHLRWLSSWLAPVRHVAYLVDPEGVVLWSTGDEAIRSAGLEPGAIWAEAQMGTNGAGTALVSDRPVAVLGCEHYAEAWQGASCLAAPLHHLDGRIAGAIDLTTSAEDGDPELLGLVAHTAFTIEHELRSRHLEAEREDREALLAAVAHDLRAPSTVVSLIADALPAAEIESARGRLKRASSQIDGLLRDLLDRSKLHGGRFHLDLEWADVAALVREVVDLHEPLAAAKRIALVYLGPGPGAEAGALAVDRRQLHRAVSNVVQNALKFTPVDGRIEVQLEVTDAEVLVSVIDTGPGVPPEQRARVFEPYWSGRLRTDGTGLGLAIADGIVKAHDGRLWVDGAPAGGGARFVLALPRPAAPTP